MRRICMLLILAVLGTVGTAWADEHGLIVKKSPHSPGYTLDRLETALTEKGITIAMRWSHSDRAEAVGITLRPTELLVFGNPKLGSHLMTSNPAAGIDLPLKALAWTDADGQTWLAYNDPAYIAARHGITDRAEIVQKMSGALAKFSDAAVAP